MKRVRREPEILTLRPGVVKRRRRPSKYYPPVEKDDVYTCDSPREPEYITHGEVKKIFKEAQRLGIKK